MNQYSIFKLASLIICVLVFSVFSKAQSWPWAVQIGSDLHDDASGTCDKEGNFYLAGLFRGSSCNFPDTVLHSEFYESIFLSKFDDQGKMKWVRMLGHGNSEDFLAFIADVIIDNDGFVYVTGKFYGEARFDPFILYSVGLGDLFLAKFSPNGLCIWATSAGGIGDDGGTAIAIDSLYSIYIAGACSKDAIFDTIEVIKGGIIAKYDPFGTCLWVKNKCGYLTFSPEFTTTAMTLRQNDLYACGYTFEDTITVDTIQIAHPNKYVNMLMCYDLNANIKWLKQGISGAPYSGNNISMDKEGNLLISGHFYDSIDFDGLILANITGGDAFFCKYNKDGFLQWARQTMATNNAWGSSIVADSAGNSYATGYFGGTAFPELGNIASEGYRDAFLIKYDSDGNSLGINHFGEAEGTQLGIDKNSNPYVVARFKEDIQVGENNFISYGGRDIVLCRSDEISGGWKPDDKYNDKLEICANPTTGKCKITVPDEFVNEKSLTLSIYDNQGKVVYSTTFSLSEDKIRINLSAYAEGTYTAVLSNGKKSCTGRIVFAGNR